MSCADILTFLTAGAETGGGAADAIIDAIVTADDPTRASIALPAVLEYGAAIAGAVSGGMIASEKKLDILGVSTLAMITALGGGLLRDMILPTSQVYLIDNPLAMIICLAVGVAVFFFSGLFYRLDKPIAVFDIISVALFTFIGADKALMAGYGFMSCMLMGVITGVGGGMCRDVCMGQVPGIFKSSNFYGICSVAGAAVYLALVENHVSKAVAAVACTVVVIGLRWISLHYNVTTVAPIDLTPKIVGPLRDLRARNTSEPRIRPRVRLTRTSGVPMESWREASGADGEPRGEDGGESRADGESQAGGDDREGTEDPASAAVSRKSGLGGQKPPA